MKHLKKPHFDDKICLVCKTLKPATNFQIRNKGGRIYLRADCNECVNERRRYLYKTKNRDKIIQRGKRWASKNKEWIAEYGRLREKRIRKERNKMSLELYHKKKENINYRIKRSLRARMYFAVTKGEKCDKTMELIGCDINKLKTHLESKFIDNMSWDNYGINGWHIDHIKPCSLFDLSKPEQQKKCFHYSNLQPLWGIDNVIKGNKYDVCA